MKKELKGIDGKVAIHCTTPEEKQIVGQMLVDGVDMSPASIEKALIEDFPICYSIWGSFWGWEYPNWTERNGYTIISAAQFIAMNTEPEAAPAWSFKTDEELAMFYIDFVRFTEKSTIPIEKFAEQPDLTPMKNALSRFFTSKRFHFQCEDGIVTNPEATVYFINGGVAVINMFAKDASTMPHCAPYFSTREAAIAHRRQNTPAIKLSDMTYDAESESYCIGLNAAHNLVNERIK